MKSVAVCRVQGSGDRIRNETGIWHKFFIETIGALSAVL